MRPHRRFIASWRISVTEDELRALPGIGPYTAAAIAAIAFNRPAAPVDGNIERVLARLNADTTPLPALKARSNTQMPKWCRMRAPVTSRKP